MSLHCWTGRAEWIDATYGYLSEEYIADSVSGKMSATCMLLDGHEGPHEFTDDDKITLPFDEFVEFKLEEYP